MLTKHVVIAGVAALLLGACGEGAPEELAQESLESTEQALLYQCPWSSSWKRTWYSTTTGLEVGAEYCSCDGTLDKYGTTRGRYQQQIYAYCQ
ncbi:hypothetical protein ACLESD_01465 [Pyxidicoccus sp. 3LFB2]